MAGVKKKKNDGKKRNKRRFYPGSGGIPVPDRAWSEQIPLMMQPLPAIHTANTHPHPPTHPKKEIIEHQWRKCGTDWRRHEQIFNGISAEGTRGRNLLLLSVVQMGLMSPEQQPLPVIRVLISCENWFASFGMGGGAVHAWENKIRDARTETELL